MSGILAFLRQALGRRIADHARLKHEMEQRSKALREERRRQRKHDWERLHATRVAERQWRLDISVLSKSDPNVRDTRRWPQRHRPLVSPGYGRVIVETLYQTKAGELFIRVGPPSESRDKWPSGDFAVTAEQAMAWLTAEKFDRDLRMDNDHEYVDGGPTIFVDVLGVADELRAAWQARMEGAEGTAA
jgi:hypothetical protein